MVLQTARRARSYLVGSLVLFSGCAGAPAADPVDPPPGFTALFNGQDLAGWHGRPHHDPGEIAAMSPEAREAFIASHRDDFARHWRVEDGALVNDGEGPYATTDQAHGDIELTLEYRLSPGADSGVYLRGTPQVQIWDHTEAGGHWAHGADRGSGGLWNNSPDAPGKDPIVGADRPVGEWNRMRIMQVGEITTVWLNDELVVDRARMEHFWDRGTPLPARGPIQLQTHGGEIHWRNVFVREIPADEATAYLADRDADRFDAIFDGATWEGWAGPLDAYEITPERTIRNRPGEGGNIYTEAEYADFVARLEFKLPPGGNSGLALRYPGEGNVAREALCELQVLDDTAEQYRDLDPRQYHGAVYGLVAPHRGFLRPVGTWNVQDVRVEGTRIQVELNGTRILDADVAAVTERMDDEPFGADRETGHFGFAGHNDPVEFRNLRIRELP